MIQNQNQKIKEDDDDEDTTSESLSLTVTDKISLGNNLVSDWAVKGDINKAGLRRGKKSSISASWKGTGKTKYQMEDVNLIEIPFNEDNNKALYCIFDGHAGKKAADAAKKYFPKELSKILSKKPSSTTDFNDVWPVVYSSVDQKMKKFEYEGATSTTLLLWRVNEDRYIQAANVGDSTAFLYRNGKPLCLTEDHRPTIKKERDRITSMGIHLENGQTRLNGLAVSRALGDHFPKEMNSGLISEPYVSPVYTITKEDSHIVIASDGLWDVVASTYVYELIKNLQTAQEMASALLKQALKSAKCTDNVTVIVVRL